jgi:hypothetical protein
MNQEKHSREEVIQAEGVLDLQAVGKFCTRSFGTGCYTELEMYTF